MRRELEYTTRRRSALMTMQNEKPRTSDTDNDGSEVDEVVRENNGLWFVDDK